MGKIRILVKARRDKGDYDILETKERVKLGGGSNCLTVRPIHKMSVREFMTQTKTQVHANVIS